MLSIFIENTSIWKALESGSNKIDTYCIGVDGQKRSKMHQSENDDQNYCMHIICMCL